MFMKLRDIRAHAGHPDIDSSFLARLLRIACCHERPDMVTYLVDIGDCRKSNLLEGACLNGCFETAPLLLDKGYLLNLTASQETAGRGHWKLYGLLAEKYGGPAFAMPELVEWAVIQEHTVLYLRLLERRGPLPHHKWVSTVRKAECHGLTSMVELLKDTHLSYSTEHAQFGFSASQPCERLPARACCLTWRLTWALPPAFTTTRTTARLPAFTATRRSFLLSAFTKLHLRDRASRSAPPTYINSPRPPKLLLPNPTFHTYNSFEPSSYTTCTLPQPSSYNQQQDEASRHHQLRCGRPRGPYGLAGPPR